jgi:hypothetical protein
MTDRDSTCIKAPPFLRFIYQKYDKLFTEMIIQLSKSDDEFTLQACTEVTKFIEDIPYYDENEFLKLVNAILPVLNLQDNLQLTRFEIILGYPTIIIDEPNMRSKWPLLGYNKLSDSTSKWLEYKSAFNLKGSCSMLKKLSLMRSKERMAIEIFLALLNAGSENYPLLKYLRALPAEEPQHEDFISWGVDMINYYTKRYDNTIYQERLRDIVNNKINPVISKIINDKSILNGFSSFGLKMLPYEMKREEVTLICSEENLFIMKIEYFCSYIEMNKDLQFTKSASYYGGMDNSSDHSGKVVDEEQNVQQEENVIVVDFNDRPSNEREFFKRILNAVANGKKVVVQNKYQIENLPTTSSIIRYVAFNSKINKLIFTFRLFFGC